MRPDYRRNLATARIETQPVGGFALVLSNGRRIESSWKLAEPDLAGLIRVAKA
jgi:hypothetical protein